MSIKARVGGGTQVITNIGAMVAGTLRPVRRVRIMRAGTLVTVFSTAQAIQASASPGFVSAEESSVKPVRVVSDSVTAVVSGGSAPYTYQWQVNDGRVAATSPSAATTAFVASIYNTTITTTAQCTVTDAFGAQAACSCDVVLVAVVPT